LKSREAFNRLALAIVDESAEANDGGAKGFDFGFDLPGSFAFDEIGSPAEVALQGVKCLVELRNVDGAGIERRQLKFFKARFDFANALEFGGLVFGEVIDHRRNAGDGGEFFKAALELFGVFEGISHDDAVENGLRAGLD